MSDIGAQVVSGVVYAILFATILPVLFLLRKVVSCGEVVRKSSHALVIIGCLPAIFILQSAYVAAALLALLELSFLAYRRFGVLPEVFRTDRFSYGDLFIPPMVFLLWLLGRRDPVLFIVPLLIAAFADIAAALFGTRFPNHRFVIFGAIRTPAGSIAYFLTSALIVIIIARYGSAESAVGAALLVALTATVAEAASPAGSDNFTAPLCASLLLALTGAKL